MRASWKKKKKVGHCGQSVLVSAPPYPTPFHVPNSFFFNAVVTFKGIHIFKKKCTLRSTGQVYTEPLR